MSETSRVEIRPWEPGDEAAICRLFERTFGHPKSEARWRWQFLGQGLPPPVMLAFDAEGEALAHFGGVPLRAQVEGRDARMIVAVDNMVDPGHRAGLRRRGLFADVVTRWVEQFCERGEVVFGYGLGNREVSRIGRRLLGFRDVEGAALLARRIPPEVPVLAQADERRGHVGFDPSLFGVGRSPPSDHDQLWERCAPRLGDGLVRDARFLRWRFAEAPGVDYEFLGVRRRGRLVVSAVLKHDYVVPDSATLVELLWDGEVPRDLTLCLRGAEARVLDAGRQHLALLLPESSPEARALEELGYGRVLSGLSLVGRSFRQELPFERIAARLHYSFADFDLV